MTRSKLVFSVKAQNNWECGRVCCQFRCQSPVSGTISVWPAPVPRSQITHYNRQPRGGKGNEIQNPNFCYQTMLSQNNHKVKVCGQFSWFLLFPVNNFSQRTSHQWLVVCKSVVWVFTCSKHWLLVISPLTTFLCLCGFQVKQFNCWWYLWANC